MKVKVSTLLTAMLVLVSLSLTSCYVESEGPVGPRGPAGEDGWSDIKIITFDVYYDAWSRDNSELNYWYYVYQTSTIDYYIVDKGAVLFYYGYYDRDGYVNKWYSIPFTNVYYDEGQGMYFEKIYDANYSPGQIELEIRDLNTVQFDYPDDRDIKVKAVILEGDLYSSLIKKGVDVKDLDALQRELNKIKGVEK